MEVPKIAFLKYKVAVLIWQLCNTCPSIYEVLISSTLQLFAFHYLFCDKCKILSLSPLKLYKITPVKYIAVYCFKGRETLPFHSGVTKWW